MAKLFGGTRPFGSTGDREVEEEQRCGEWAVGKPVATFWFHGLEWIKNRARAYEQLDTERI